jgi:ABC-type branched-subunit amino acid transport system ATPase component
VKEAAAIGFKMDHFIGNWWSASDADVVPAGDGAKGYKGATFHAPGTAFKVHSEIVRVLYDKGKGAGKKEEMGSPLYNRGIVNAMLSAEALRTAMTKFGNKPLTGEQVRWGFENLNLTERRLDELGMKGFTHPIKVSCEDHEGNGSVLFQQWDGKKWNIVSDWVAPMREVVRPKIEAAAVDEGKKLELHHARLREGEVGRRPDVPAAGGQQHRGDLRSRDPRVEGRLAAGPEGGIVALLGANGAGKSTTLKAISGLLRTERGEVTKGSIELRGEPIHRGPGRGGAARRRAGDGGRHVFEHLTVEENLLAGGVYPAQRRGHARRPRAGVSYFPRLVERRGSARATSRAASSRCSPSAGRSWRARAHAARRAVDGAGPHAGGEIFDIVAGSTARRSVAVLLAEQNATMALRSRARLRDGERRIVLDGDARTISDNEDIKEFYSGLSGVGQRKSYRT